MKWILHLGELEYEVLYFTGLVHQLPDSLSRLINPSDTQKYESIEDEIFTFESSSAGLKQLKEKGEPGTSLLDNSFETMNVLSRSQTASQTTVDDNLESSFDINDWITEANKPYALYVLAIPL